MFVSIFSDGNLFHLVEILFWLIGALVIGLFFGYLMGKSKKTLSPPTIAHHFEEINSETENTTIRAKKTFERGGVISENKLKDNKIKSLDFKTIGIATEETKDNLQKINGIGKTAELKLNEIGIFTFKQISNLNSTDVEKLTGMINFFPGRIAKDDWIGQALELLKKKN